jgi:hypothetical protein
LEIWEGERGEELLKTESVEKAYSKQEKVFEGFEVFIKDFERVLKASEVLKAVLKALEALKDLRSFSEISTLLGSRRDH